MKRRDALAAIASLCLPAKAWSQASPKVARVGYLANTVPLGDLERRVPSHPAHGIIEAGLRDLGWIEGKNLRFVWRSAEGRYDRLPALVDELIAEDVDVIIAFGGGVVAAARKTRTIPIVMGAIGLVEQRYGSLSRPGGNITGTTLDVTAEIDGKRLSLLKQAAPSITQVAFLTDNVPDGSFNAATVEAAAALRLRIFPVGRVSAERVPAAFAEALERRADALLVTEAPIFHWPHVQSEMHALAVRHRVPVMHTAVSAAESGGLMSYGSDILDNYRRVPYFVDRILRGAKPSEIPIEQPTRFYLMVNRAAARSIGLSLPASLLAQADKVFG